MQIVLLERVDKLGKIGDVVKVKDGFARNYLLPRKKALRATKANIERFERERASLEARNQEQRALAEGVARDLGGKTYVILCQAGESGQLYGSVAPRDIAASIAKDGYAVERGDIHLATPIKAIGLHTVSVVLHAEVRTSVVVNVARSAEEAERQARGEIIVNTRDNADVEEDEDEIDPALFEGEPTAEGEEQA